MALALKDLLKKAEQKGFEKLRSPSSLKNTILTPWQQESILFSQNKLGNEIENNSGTNRERIREQGNPKIDNEIGNKKDNNLENKQGTFREQTGNISGTFREHLENKQGTFREQTGNDSGIYSDNELGNDIVKLQLARLSGIQYRLFFYAFDICLIREDETTGYIHTAQMAETLKCSYESAKMSLKRLIGKELICRMKGKTSRGGFIILSVPKEVKSLVLQMKIRNIENRSVNESGNDLEKSDPSYNNNKNITIGEGWDKIEFSALEPIGFKKNLLLQLKKVNTPEIVQESINHFVFALEMNEKVKKYETPLNVLIPVLKRGDAWIEPNYISQRERALQKVMEAKKAEEGRLEKIEKEWFDREFKEWESGLSEERKNEIASSKFPPQIVQLQSYFRANFWKDIKESLLPEGIK